MYVQVPLWVYFCGKDSRASGIRSSAFGRHPLISISQSMIRPPKSHKTNLSWHCRIGDLEPQFDIIPQLDIQDGDYQSSRYRVLSYGTESSLLRYGGIVLY